MDFLLLAGTAVANSVQRLLEAVQAQHMAVSLTKHSEDQQQLHLAAQNGADSKLQHAEALEAEAEQLALQADKQEQSAEYEKAHNLRQQQQRLLVDAQAARRHAAEQQVRLLRQCSFVVCKNQSSARP